MELLQRRQRAGRRLAIAAVLIAGLFPVQRVGADELKTLLDTVRAVGPKGEGHPAASKAGQQLTQRDIGDLTTILAACDGSNALAANWICGAAEAMAGRQTAAGHPLPLAELERFVTETSHAPIARRLAFEWLAKADPTAADRLIPGMLNDPGLEFRRDAVVRLLEQATKAFDAKETETALALYQQALTGARDLDQVKTITGRLKELEHPVELPTYFGFLMEWKAIGPFDNTNESGFAIAYPPEREFDPNAVYEGKGQKVNWVDARTSDDYGLVDLNKALNKHMGAVAYVAAEFVARAAQDVELRFGSTNANKLWLNGKLLAENDAYHAGDGVDQYIVKGRLVAGRNVIVLKVCQNEQTESWAQDWSFQLRVCDLQGAALLAENRPPLAPPPAVDPAAAQSR